MHPYLKIGTKDTNDIALNHQIICLNVTLYAFIFMSVPFIFIFPSDSLILKILPCLFIPIGIMGILLNKTGLFVVSRWFTIIGFLICLDTWFAYLTAKGDNIPNSFLILHFIMLIIPWFMFSIKEYMQLFSIIFIFLGFTLSLPYLIDNLNVEEVFTTQYDTWFVTVSYMTMIIGNGLLLFVSSLLKDEQIDLYTQSLEESNLRNEMLIEKEKLNNENLEKIKVNQIIEKNRIWISDGLTKINEILRDQELSIVEIYNQFISFAVKYLNANQAGLFLCENDALHLKACYAYGRKKYLEKIIRYGEGLVGQTYLEGETTIITEVPENYISITSGLGATTPRFLILVPIQQNDLIFGILELASLKELEVFEIELLETACANLASYVNIFITKDKTDQLIIELKDRTEQMKSQEEMVRQSMTEMENTLTELHNQAELKKRQEEVLKKNMEELTSVQIELQRKSDEINLVRVQEAQRADVQIATQKQMLDRFIQKTKEKEQQLQNKITELEKSKITTSLN